MDYARLILGFGVFGLILLWTRRRRQKFMESFRGSADEAFRNLLLESGDPSFSFCGADAQVELTKEDVEESGGALLAYTQTRIARNAAGEYFYFSYRSDSKPYFKHLPQGTAKILLGDRRMPKGPAPHGKFDR